MKQAIELLKKMIALPSLSREEEETASLILHTLESEGVDARRHKNNVWAGNKYFDPEKPTLLLNSHHDTVAPAEGYTRDPYTPHLAGGKIYGLGANDAGGPLVSLLAAFLHFYEENKLKYNLVIAATAEEEISGENGISSILAELPPIDCAIVGEPTGMQMAVAEKGLMVLDCTAAGQSGHAARNEGINAIYEAMKDIAWFKEYRFENTSEFLGPVKMSVTGIQGGTKHNVVPESCTFMVDVRTTDAYSNLEVLEIIREHTCSEIIPRSTRLNPSSIPEGHPMVQAGKKLGLQQYGSSTLSDQALLSVPSVKIGPGESSRSHTADEFIKIQEIEDGIETYIKLITQLQQQSL